MNYNANLTQARKSIVEAVMTMVGSDLFRHAVAIAHTRTDQETAPEQVLDSMIGSGTLVQVDGADGHTRFGILTCGHATAALARARNEKGRRFFTLLLPSTRARGEDKAWSVQIVRPRVHLQEPAAATRGRSKYPQQAAESANPAQRWHRQIPNPTSTSVDPPTG